jgi:hypothetical protein
VIWHLKDTAAADDERHAVRLIGLAFVALSIYIAIQAVVTVALDVRPFRHRSASPGSPRPVW